ncbi:hypothetical protein FRC06_011018 [Ceratobasidium sp. 370]|nr:hypothetical protein FRC06_011018 [Ceratobasidium sp. 370]
MDNKDGIVDASHEPHDKAAAGIRSRITVVCAECKRLKLKCDRRAPCSSCVKRETTARCVYSAAAAEKIDVQSLHNRVSALEESWRQWTNTQPAPTSPPPPPPAIVASGPDDVASALVGIDDVSALWAAHLGLHLPHIPLRPSTPDDSDQDDSDDDIPPSLARARQIPTSTRTGVTRAHVQLLPPRPIRAALWSAAERAIGSHAGLAPFVRARFERMCVALEGESGTGPVRQKWPLSLLAVGTAGLAIGAQVVAESDGAIPLPSSAQTPGSSSSSAHSHSQHPSPISPPISQLPCVRTLAALSLRSLSPNGRDTDAVLAALLHAARGTLDGRARIAPRVWPDVCRAVGVARGMGLGVDREGAGKEVWRRRVWWEVYCADLFTSDYVGLPPSIDDSTFSTALPQEDDGKDDEEEDREREDGMAYFILNLAQLIKTLKRRLLDERPLPLEGAAAMERAVSDFMRDLPPAWKLDMSVPAVAMGLGDEEAAIMVQRCELAAAANSLILKAYHPFLKRSVAALSSSSSTPTTSEAFASPHQAALACSSAAHALIHASLAAHQLLPRTRPKAEAAMGVGSSGIGMKRKRGQDSVAGAGDEGLGIGFEMPYMGPGVVTCGLEGESESEKEREGTVAPVQPPQPPATTATTMPPVEHRREREPKRESKPAKVSPYPRIGVRVRNKPPGTKMARSRAGSSGNGERSPAGVPSQQVGQQQANGLVQQPNGLAQQPNGLSQQPSPLGQQPQQPQQPPSSTPSISQQMTVPHQPPLQVITEQAPPYLNGSGNEYTGYAEPSYAMPYLMNTPATPVVRSDYSREFYGGYEYAPPGPGVMGMMPEGMMPEYGKDGMMPEYAKEGMGMGESAGGMMVGENGEGAQQGWYRHPSASAGPAPGGQTQQGPWNASFDAPGWDARR